MQIDKKKCFKETIFISFPIIFSHFVGLLVPFINTYLAAQINIDALASLALVNSTYMSFMGLGWGIITAVGILTSQKIGADDYKNIGLFVKAGFFVSIFLGIIFMIIFVNFSWVWMHLGQNKNIVALAQTVLTGLALGAIPDLLRYALFQYCISFRNTKIPTIANLATFPLIYYINKALIFGEYGFPKLGVFGIGIGTSIIFWSISLFMLLYVYMDSKIGKYLRNIIKFKDYILYTKKLLKLGIPIGIMFSIEISFFMAFSIMMGIICEDALAAYQICHQWIFTIIVIAYGLAEAVIILVGRAFGSGDIKLARLYSINCILISTFLVGMASICYWIDPQYFIGFDLDLEDQSNSQIIFLTTKFLIYGGIFQLIDSFRIIVSGALRGMNFSEYPMWITFIAFCIIGVPLSYFLSFTVGLGVDGLWIGLLIAVALSCVFQFLKLKKEFLRMDRDLPKIAD